MIPKYRHMGRIPSEDAAPAVGLGQLTGGE